MKAIKRVWMVLTVPVWCAIPLVGKDVTYEWKSVQFLGCVYFVPTRSENGNYVASESYTLRGLWKKIENGKVVDENVACENVDNVCIHDKYNPNGVPNGGTLRWKLPLAVLPTKFTVASCKNGRHTFKSPDAQKSHSDNQQTKVVEIDRPVPPG